MARPRRGHGVNGARESRPRGGAPRSYRFRVRSRRNPVRHRRGVPGAGPPARHTTRANGFTQRRRRPGGRGSRRRAHCRLRARVAVRVVVVGAGIAGLAAAWELTRTGGVDVTLLESERRAGGVIVTEHVEGFVVEGGPDGFLASEPELPELANELGIGDHLVGQGARGTALWTGKALEPIEEGRAAQLLGIDASSAEVKAGFRSFANGMGEPVAALAERLAGTLRLAQGVAGLVRRGSRWHVAITGGSAHDADGIVLALATFSCALIWGQWMAIRRRPRTPSSPQSSAFAASRCGRACSTGTADCRATARVMPSMSPPSEAASAGSHLWRSPGRATTEQASRPVSVRGARRRASLHRRWLVDERDDLLGESLHLLELRTELQQQEVHAPLLERTNAIGDLLRCSRESRL